MKQTHRTIAQCVEAENVGCNAEEGVLPRRG